MRKLTVKNDFEEFGHWIAIANPLNKDGLMISCPVCNIGIIMLVKFAKKGDNHYLFCGYCNYLFEEGEI